MLFPLIETWAALPRRTEAYLTERQWFDLKATYAPGKQAEMAKDIAAFANAVGGALIIGAKEGPTEPDYSAPLASVHAEKLTKDFDEAVRNFCRPSPTVHVRTIPSPDAQGKVVLVVNVEPAADQPIAAQHPTSTDAWRFPIRLGRDTEFLLPEQLPLYMDSKARRAKLLLLRALAAGGEIDLFYVPAGYLRRSSQASVPHKLVEVDAGGNGGALLRYDGEVPQTFVLPLDDVAAVWLQQNGRWALRIGGRMNWILYNDGKRAWVYLPPTTFVVSPESSAIEEVKSEIRDLVRALRGTLVVQQFGREPTEAEIRQRAHAIWLARQEREETGSAHADWMAARLALLAERHEG